MEKLPCSNKDCNGASRNKRKPGLCSACRSRLYRNGDLGVRKSLANGELLETLRAANQTATEECVEYPGQKNTRRPVARIDGVQMNASRAAWILLKGDPGEAHVLHRCHNKRCVNVAHLYLGDHVRNMKDMAEAGRADRFGKAKGTDHGRTHLSEDDVREIRRRHAGCESQASIARYYGVAQTTISAIVRRVTWPHLD